MSTARGERRTSHLQYAAFLRELGRSGEGGQDAKKTGTKTVVLESTFSISTELWFAENTQKYLDLLLA